MHAYLLLALFWGLFCSIHSVLAADRVKEWVRTHIQGLYPYYRLVYNLIALATLSGTIYYHGSLPEQDLFRTPAGTDVLGWTLIVIGGVIVGWSIRGYDTSEMLGMRQIGERFPQAHDTLNTGGFNSYVRHPLYFGSLLFIWGFLIERATLAMLIAAILLTGYLYVGVRLEEQKLVRAFGKAYRNYQQRVPMLIPFFSTGRKKSL